MPHIEKYLSIDLDTKKIEESKPVAEETPKVETNKEVYKNVDEINKIMNKCGNMKMNHKI